MGEILRDRKCEERYFGMMDEEFSYDGYQSVRDMQVKIIHINLTVVDRTFL